MLTSSIIWKLKQRFMLLDILNSFQNQTKNNFQTLIYIGISFNSTHYLNILLLSNFKLGDAYPSASKRNILETKGFAYANYKGFSFS